MGMFDTVKINIDKLPVSDKIKKELRSEFGEFQTKCFDNMMTSYTITDDNKLTTEITRYVAVPKSERPKSVNDKWHHNKSSVERIGEHVVTLSDYEGAFNFYTSVNGGDNWVEFIVTFDKGILKEIIFLEELY